MVTNSSGLGEDLSSLGSWAGDQVHAVGQAVGLVDADLIPGDAPATGAEGEHLIKLGDAFERAGQGFKAIDTGSWHGAAADAAGEYLSAVPKTWFSAADAHHEAGTAVAEYQRVLAEMQAKAARAKEDLQRAEKASEQARDAHNAQVDAFNASDRTGPRPAEFSDPAAGDIAAAKQAIADAKRAVKEAGDRAARVVNAAAAEAPDSPGMLTNLMDATGDAVQAMGSLAGDVAGGALGAVHEMGQMARMFNPIDPHNLAHPGQAVENVSTMAMGVVGAVQDPYAAVKTVVDVDGWRNNPAKTAGSMVPDALMSLAGGAGAAGRVARGAGKLAKSGDELAGTGKLAPDSGPPSSAATKVDHGLDANGEPFRPGPESDGLVRPSEVNASSPSQPEPRPMDAREVQAPHNIEVRPEARSHEPPTASAAAHNPEAQPRESVPDHRGDQAGPRGSTAEAPERAGETTVPKSDAAPPHSPDRSDSLRDTPDEHHGDQPAQRSPTSHQDEPDSPSNHDDHSKPGPHPDESDRHDDSGDQQTREDDSSPDEDGKDNEDAETNNPGETPADSPPEYDGIPLGSKYEGEHLPDNEVFGTPVTYLDEVERLDYKLHVDQDGLLRDADGDLFDTRDATSLHNPDGGRAIFVMDRNGDIYASSYQEAGRFHHSSFLSGDPVAAAGELGVKDGKVELISNQSGHYKPGEESVGQFMRHLFKREGAELDLPNLDVRFVNGR